MTPLDFHMQISPVRATSIRYALTRLIGHGGYDQDLDEGTLALADHAGRARRVSAEDPSRLSPRTIPCAWWCSVAVTRGSMPSGPVTQVYGVAFRPDGQWLATAGRDKTARIWMLSGAG